MSRREYKITLYKMEVQENWKEIDQFCPQQETTFRILVLKGSFRLKP